MGFCTEQLKSENQIEASKFIDMHDDPSFIRFWDEKVVQIDGNCKLQYLKDLVKLMENFQ